MAADFSTQRPPHWPEPLADTPQLRAVQVVAMADYTYALPENRIAQHPLPQRDAAKLLHYLKGACTHQPFAALPNLLPTGALLLFNTTRVVPARLVFHRKTGGRVELFCLGPTTGTPEVGLATKGAVNWQCLAGNAKRWKPGEPLELPLPGGVLVAERGAALAEGIAVHFRWTPADRSFAEVLSAAGQIPLPPYLNRAPEAADTQRYQTVFAKQDGAVAAPTAGLHFTPQVLQALDEKAIERAEFLLHVGAGTFKPVGSASLGGHAMHGEYYAVSGKALRQVANALAAGRPVIPVGTTSLRTLETLYWRALAQPDGPLDQWAPYRFTPRTLPPPSEVFAWLTATFPNGLSGQTELLIAPGYPRWVASGLITNFHQPGSTLLVLIAALLGDAWKDVYAYAQEHSFRFLSYGDSSLLLP